MDRSGKVADQLFVVDATPTCGLSRRKMSPKPMFARMLNANITVPFLFGIVLSVFVAGCPKTGTDVPEIGGQGEQNQPKIDVTANSKTPTENDRLRRSQCEQKLATAVGGTSYDRLDIDTDRSTQLADLNAWVATCFDAEDAEALTNDAELRHQFLPPAMHEIVDQEKFSAVDLLHLRNAQLSQAIGLAAVEDASDDVRVMVDLFAKVVRNVQLVDASIGELPYDPFSLWQAGIGSARDRAWLFALLLRQYRIDPVVIEFPAGFNAQPYLLVAGVTRGDAADAYLFDPITGLPVPSLSDDGAIPTKPVSWSEATANDAIFRALDTDQLTYPLRADRFRNARVFLVGDVSTFSPRMAAIQDELPAGESFQLYDGLGENIFANRGLISRIAAAMKIEENSLQLWPHGLLGRLPQIQPTEQVQRILMNRETVLSAPYDVTVILNADGTPKIDENGNSTVRISLRSETLTKMREARIAHLTGQYSKASRAYLMVRVAEPPIPQNTQASVDAAYWTTVFQYESGKVDNAKSSLQSFLNRDDKGAWGISARRLLATILAAEDDFEAAVKVARGPAVDLGLMALVDRWRDQRRLSSNDDDKAPADSTSPMKSEAEDGEAIPEAGDDPDVKPVAKPSSKTMEAKPDTEPKSENTSVKKPKEPADVPKSVDSASSVGSEQPGATSDPDTNPASEDASTESAQ